MTVASSRGLRRGGIFLAAAIVLGGGLWLATRPDGRSEHSAPSRGVTARVERRPLSISVIVRGSVVVVDEVAVTAPPRPDGQTSSVVTASPLKPNSSVDSGRPLVEINGRPILALAIGIPLYRDLVAGTVGPDVAALRSELTRLGYDTSTDAPSLFGAATQSAVDQLFKAAGYEAAYSAGSRADYEAGVTAAQTNVDDALAAANRSRAAGTIDPSLEAAVDEAIAARNQYRDSKGVMVRVGEIARLPAAAAAVVGPVPQVGASFAPGDVLLTVALPKPQVHIALSQAQASTVSSSTKISVSGSSYSASCKPGDIVATHDSGSDQTGSGPASGDVPETETTTTSSPSSGQAGGSDESSSSDIEMVVGCEPAPALDDVGTDYRATLTTAVAGKHLVVPVTAVVTAADGNAYVRVERNDHLERTSVTVLAEAGGFVAIESEPGELQAGDRVRVSNN